MLLTKVAGNKKANTKAVPFLSPFLGSALLLQSRLLPILLVAAGHTQSLQEGVCGTGRGGYGQYVVVFLSFLPPHIFPLGPVGEAICNVDPN